MNTYYWVSIDPGKTGAICKWNGNQPFTIVDLKCRKGQRFFGDNEMADMDYELSKHGEFAILEGLLSMKMPMQSFTHSNTTAVNHGILQALLYSNCFETTMVPPSVWKSKLGLKGGKENKNLSIEMALDLYPHMEKFIHLKKHHDRAEALLIGHYYGITKWEWA